MTDKQRKVLVALSEKQGPVSAETLGCSAGVLGRMERSGLVYRDRVGNLGQRAWGITRNGLILVNMWKPGSVAIPPIHRG